MRRLALLWVAIQAFGLSAYAAAEAENVAVLGQEAHLLGAALNTQACRFIIPGDGGGFTEVLTKDSGVFPGDGEQASGRSAGWTYQWYGVEDNDCGITILNTVSEDAGDWKYSNDEGQIVTITLELTSEGSNGLATRTKVSAGLEKFESRGVIARIGEPDEIATLGKEANLLGGTLDTAECKFLIPGDGGGKTKALTKDNGIFPKGDDTVPGRPAGWQYKWYGVNSKDCGITILNTVLEDGDVWKYEDDEEILISLTLELIKPPTSKTFVGPEIDNAVLTTDVLESQVNVTCYLSDVMGQPNVTFEIDDPDYTLNISNADVSLVDFTHSNGTIDWLASFLYSPQSEHSGNKLQCIVFHDSYTEEDYDNEIHIEELLLSIAGPPPADEIFMDQTGLTQGKPGELAFQFKSNPEPTSIVWALPDAVVSLNETVPERTLDAGQSTVQGRYTVTYSGVSGQNDTFRSTLEFDKFKSTDQEMTVTFSVVNEYGTVSIQRTLTKAKTSGLSGGAIAGIVIGCVVFVLLLLVAAFFGWKYAKKRKAKKRAMKQVQKTAQATVDRLEVQGREQGIDNQAHDARISMDIDLKRQSSVSTFTSCNTAD